MRMSWDFFLLFFPAFLFELIVNQTNLYARQRQQTRPDPRWTPVTEEEMKAWLGMRVAMSILYLPQTAMYWSTDSLFGNLAIKKVMTRDRFDKISQYFHLNDSMQNLPRDNQGRDKIFHVRPIHDTAGSVPHYLQCTSECQYRRGHDKVQRKTSFSPVYASQTHKVWYQSLDAI